MNLNSAARFFSSYTRGRRKRLLTAWGLTWGTRLSLWILPFSAVRTLIVPRSPRSSDEARRRIPGDRTPRPARAEPDDPGELDEIVRSIQSVSRFVPRATCLTQALVAQRLLAQAGIESSLQIGVARGDRRVDAHAWVEVAGRPVIGDIGLDRFTRLRVPGGPPG